MPLVTLFPIPQSDLKSVCHWREPSFVEVVRQPVRSSKSHSAIAFGTLPPLLGEIVLGDSRLSNEAPDLTRWSDLSGLKETDWPAEYKDNRSISVDASLCVRDAAEDAAFTIVERCHQERSVMRISMAWPGRSVTAGRIFTGSCVTSSSVNRCGDHGQDQRRFEHRERVADADARAAAERKIGVFGQRLARPSAQRSGSKSQRVVEPPWVAMHDPLAHQDIRAGGNEVAADRHVFERPAADDISRRIEPHRFADDLLAEDAASERRRRSAAGRRERFGRFLLHAVLNVGMLAEQIPGPGRGRWRSSRGRRGTSSSLRRESAGRRCRGRLLRRWR